MQFRCIWMILLMVYWGPMPFSKKSNKYIHGFQFYLLLVITLGTSYAVLTNLWNPSDLSKTHVLVTGISALLAAVHHLGNSAPLVFSVWTLGQKSSPSCSLGRRKRARECWKNSMALKTSAWERGMPHTLIYHWQNHVTWPSLMAVEHVCLSLSLEALPVKLQSEGIESS